MNLESRTAQQTSALDAPLFCIGATEVAGDLLVTAVLIVIASVALSLSLRGWVVRGFEKRESTDDGPWTAPQRRSDLNEAVWRSLNN